MATAEATRPTTRARTTRNQVNAKGSASTAATAKGKAASKAGAAVAAAATTTTDAAQRQGFMRAANLLKMTADGTRLQVLTTLLGGEMNVGDLCELMQMSQPSTSHHLAILRHGGLIQPRRDGKFNRYSLTDEGRRLATMVRGFIGD